MSWCNHEDHERLGYWCPNCLWRRWEEPMKLVILPIAAAVLFIALCAALTAQ